MSRRHRLQNQEFKWKFTVDQICGGKKPHMSRKEFERASDNDCVIYGAVAKCFSDSGCSDCSVKFTKKDCVCYTNWVNKQKNKGV